MEGVVRIARVSEPLPKVEMAKRDHVDEAIDKVVFSAKALMLVFLATITILLGVWATWNLKNNLHIDLMSGGHHDTIDQVNEAFGI